MTDAAGRPPNSIADLVRLAGALHADALTLRRAAVMLGLAPLAEPVELAGQDAPSVSAPASTGLPVFRRTAPAADTTTGEIRPAGDDPRRVQLPRLTLTEPAAATPPRRLPGSVFELLPSVTAVGDGQPPLLAPAHQRAVLSGLAALDRPGQEVDVETVVKRTANREPIEVVPRLPEPTTRLGVLLLVDRGPAMAPFRRDVRLLVVALRQVVGADAVEVVNLRSDPGAALPLSTALVGVDRTRPILLVSDLGIAPVGGTPRPSAWLRLAAAAREAGCPLVVLVPYPSTRWPGWATERLALAQWDRPTDAGHARRVARRAALLAGRRR